jgi:HSP20 family protein
VQDADRRFGAHNRDLGDGPGERRDEHSQEKNGPTLREVRYGSFRRSFALPSHVGGDAVTATYEAGVLIVRVAGAYAGSEPQRIAIN